MNKGCLIKASISRLSGMYVESRSVAPLSVEGGTREQFQFSSTSRNKLCVLLAISNFTDLQESHYCSKIFK